MHIVIRRFSHLNHIFSLNTRVGNIYEDDEVENEREREGKNLKKKWKIMKIYASWFSLFLDTLHEESSLKSLAHDIVRVFTWHSLKHFFHTQLRSHTRDSRRVVWRDSLDAYMSRLVSSYSHNVRKNCKMLVTNDMKFHISHSIKLTIVKFNKNFSSLCWWGLAAECKNLLWRQVQGGLMRWFRSKLFVEASNEYWTRWKDI